MPELNCGEIGWVKLDLLSRGIEIDNSIAQFMRTTSPVALRKNFYNTPLWVDHSLPVPQELRLSGVVVGLNSYGPSIWRLKWPGEGTALILENNVTGQQYQPKLIEDLRLFAEIKEAGHIANLYGGTALAFFSPRTCYLFADGTECRFCSLAGTAKETKNYKAILSDREIEETVSEALALDKERIEQIMIVGGNMRDLDAGFRHHISLAKAASTVLERAGLSKAVSVHIATMPPFDLDLIKMLADFENVHVMFNLEVWDQGAFSVICPGKERDYGRKKTLKALEILRDVIGAYRAHSLLVT